VHRPNANSRLALTLRRLRSRFGISAPRVAVRMRLPWHWRAVVTVVLLAVALVLAGWIYDTGRRIAGFDRSESNQELGELREKVAQLQQEMEHQRRIADAGESAVQIERSTGQQLSLQVKRLEAENARLKEDLASFEALAQGEAPARPGLSIRRLRVAEDIAGSGVYRYRMLVAQQGAKQEREFNGTLQLVVTLQQDGKLATMTFPGPAASEEPAYSVSLRHFKRLEGVFRVPAGAIVKHVEARILQDGSVAAKEAVTV